MFRFPLQRIVADLLDKYLPHSLRSSVEVPTNPRFNKLCPRGNCNHWLSSAIAACMDDLHGQEITVSPDTAETVFLRHKPQANS